MPSVPNCRVIVVGSSYEPLGLFRRQLPKLGLMIGFHFCTTMSTELAELMVVPHEKQLLIVCDDPDSIRAGQEFVLRMEKKNKKLNAVNSSFLTGAGDRIDEQMLRLSLRSTRLHILH